MRFENCAIGMEFGSTRIKAVLVDESGKVLAMGTHSWENKYENGVWTYSDKDVIGGMQACYADLKKDVKTKYGSTLTTVGAIGVSAMMHGYLVFDKDGRLLVPFRTWRNNCALFAAEKLTELFDRPIPARWSVAHLYHAIEKREEHVAKIAFQTTLAGWIHYLLTGKKVVGIDEASGMFPTDPDKKDFDEQCVSAFDEKILKKNGLPFTLRDIFPTVGVAGDAAGFLTEKGARLLDPEGDLEKGIPFCPPEGDAATGMVAANAIKKGSGNISAGTSVFAMIVLDRPLERRHPEIDIVATPVGDPVAMVHCNNCTSDINAWAEVFADFSKRLGADISKEKLFDLMFKTSLEGDADCGKVVTYNYVSGEDITKVREGRPLLVRKTDSSFTLPNLLRSQIYSSIATLKIGLDILTKEENVAIRSIVGHGGLFKTEKVAQQYLANAVRSPVTVTKTAGEGGAFGMAVLALYLINGKGAALSDYLDGTIFSSMESLTLYPDKDADGLDGFIELYKKGLPIVKAAEDAL